MTGMQENLKDLLSYNSLVHAVSGAVGGFTAMTVFFPLDTARTILQVDDSARKKLMPQVIREILQQKGVAGLYQGWFPVVSSLWCSNFVYFYSYNFLKLAFYGKAKPSPWKDIGAASLAGIINVLVTTPMWVVNMRLKLQGKSRQRLHKSRGDDDDHKPLYYSGIIDCFAKVINNEGVGALWNGTGPSLLLVCNPTIQFVVYEALKRRVTRLLGTDKIGSLMLFMMGAIAKAVATLVTYPVQVLQSRLRAQNSKDGRKTDITSCIQHIIRSNGWSGFYKGIEAKLLQTILMAALMFTTYEHISRTVFKVMRASVQRKS